jgi:hypothetical protein
MQKYITGVQLGSKDTIIRQKVPILLQSVYKTGNAFWAKSFRDECDGMMPVVWWKSGGSNWRGNFRLSKPMPTL